MELIWFFLKKLKLFFHSTLFDRHCIFSLLLYFFYALKKKGMIKMYVGTVTISVAKDSDNKIEFQINTDNDDLLPVSYVIEDVLKKY